MQYNSDYVPPQSGMFRCLKITLIVLEVVNIIGSIIVIAYGFIELGVAEDQKPEKQQELRTNATILIVSGIIAILILILGLYGTLKENFNLLIAFGVIIALLSITSFVAKNVWYGVFNMFLAAISFYFAYLISRNRGQNLA